MTEKKSKKQRPWTHHEDKLIAQMVRRHGENGKWNSVAAQMPGRTAKQCRDRWQNHLNPNLKRSNWTEDEDRTIMEMHKRIGTRWSEMCKELVGRTDNNIKNRWNSTLRRVERARQHAGGKLPPKNVLTPDGRPDILFAYAVELMEADPDFKVPLPKSRRRRKNSSPTSKGKAKGAAKGKGKGTKRKRKPSSASSFTAKRTKRTPSPEAKSMPGRRKPNLSALAIPDVDDEMVAPIQMYNVDPDVPAPVRDAMLTIDVTNNVSISSPSSMSIVTDLGSEFASDFPLFSPSHDISMAPVKKDNGDLMMPVTPMAWSFEPPDQMVTPVPVEHEDEIMISRHRQPQHFTWEPSELSTSGSSVSSMRPLELNLGSPMHCLMEQEAY